MPLIYLANLYAQNLFIVSFAPFASFASLASCHAF
jgi:hypothetical protein